MPTKKQLRKRIKRLKKELEVANRIATENFLCAQYWQEKKDPEANLWDDFLANTRYDDRLGRFRCVLFPSYKQSPSKDSDVWWE